MTSQVSPRAAPPAVPQGGAGWTRGRVAGLVAGAVLALLCAALLTGAAVLAGADVYAGRSGYLTAGAASYSSPGYALVSNPVRLDGAWRWLGRFAGSVRIQVTPADPAVPVFAGIASAGEVSRYLAGAGYTTVPAVGDAAVTEHAGTAVPAPPGRAVPWVKLVAGTGTQTLEWAAVAGNWSVVVMNQDGSKPVAVRVSAAVSSPVLPWLAGELAAAAVFLAVPATLLIVVPIRRAVSTGGCLPQTPSV
jgi:hypothetical protein